ncbi:MAG: DUF2007 domain-containing protein [Actinophytocola sp.]|nr:DUF2007 domain-containing protein [Actinophytocola sp.]
MIALLNSNDPVQISYAEALLLDAGIDHEVVDSHMSVIEGSIGALPKRVLVAEDRYEDARRLLIDAELL